MWRKSKKLFRSRIGRPPSLDNDAPPQHLHPIFLCPGKAPISLWAIYSATVENKGNLKFWKQIIKKYNFSNQNLTFCTEYPFKSQKSSNNLRFLQKAGSWISSLLQ